MVVAQGSPEQPVIVERRRVELVSANLPHQPYHAVGMGGAPRSVIAKVEKAAGQAVSRALHSVPGVASVGLVAAERNLPVDIDLILHSHPRLHSAEGRLYEQAVLEASYGLGLPAVVIRPDNISVSQAIDAAGRAAGPPWQKDHKWAATAALASLARTSIKGGKDRAPWPGRRPSESETERAGSAIAIRTGVDPTAQHPSIQRADTRHRSR